MAGVRSEPPGHTEIADLQLAVLVDQKVGRFEVPVEDVGRMDVFEAAKELVEEVADVLQSQGLRGVDDLVEVRLHQVQHHVDGAEVAVGPPRPQDVFDGDDVVVLEVLQDLQLAQSALRVGHHVERVRDLLDGHRLPGVPAPRGADDAVGSGADGFDDLVVVPHLEGDVERPRLQ